VLPSDVDGKMIVSKWIERLQVLMAARMKVTAFWKLALCSLVEIDRPFTGAYCPHQHGDLKRRSTSTKLHGAMSQKAVIFIVWTVVCVVTLCSVFTS
jgi:hypothetical protein